MVIGFMPEIGSLVLDPITERAIIIDNALFQAAESAALAMCIEYGQGAFSIEENRPAILANFRAARNRTLQKLGVLDESLKIIPGQEEVVAQLRW